MPPTQTFTLRAARLRALISYMQRCVLTACLALLLLAVAIPCVAAIENYNVYVQQGTGDWSFITFYPLRLVIRPNDTVTFVQSYDIGIIALPAPGVSTALLTPVASDPAYATAVSIYACRAPRSCPQLDVPESTFCADR